MSDDESVLGAETREVSRADASQEQAAHALAQYCQTNNSRVFFSRQLEVQYENKWFHWITNRAIRQLVASGVLNSETRTMSTGQTIHLVWHKDYRYHRREANRVVGLVEEYADPNIGGAIGLHGELLVLEGFASRQFVMKGREANSFGERAWTNSDHNLDFIFERDGIAYGVEVKNTLGYMDHNELLVKIDLCHTLGIRPLFACRMLPKSWINEIVHAGGFALIMKYQLYPWTHRELAKRVKKELDLPVDAPRRLNESTMERFVRWHVRQL